MPNVGWGEMIVIVLIALVVFGPDKLPDMMKSLGKGLRAFQAESGKAMDTLRSATEEASTTPGAGVIDRPDGWVEPPAPSDGSKDEVVPNQPSTDQVVPSDTSRDEVVSSQPSANGVATNPPSVPSSVPPELHEDT